MVGFSNPVQEVFHLDQTYQLLILKKGVLRLLHLKADFLDEALCDFGGVGTELSF